MIAALASVAPASIPSPSSGTLTIGPLNLNAYGLMIALGVVAAVWLFGRRLEQKGIGTREDANAIALWGVVAGVIGARLYHVLTDWERYSDNLGDIVKIWEGGLGHPRRDARRRARRRLRRPREAGHPARARARRGGADAPAGPGHRSLGQLLQPGAVRAGDDAAVGPGDRRRPPAGRPGVPAGHRVPPDVPLRVPVELRPVRTADPDRPALPPGRRPAAGDVRPRLRRRPLLGRGPAHRRGRPPRRPALEPVGRRRLHRRRRALPPGHDPQAQGPDPAADHPR